MPISSTSGLPVKLSFNPDDEQAESHIADAAVNKINNLLYIAFPLSLFILIIYLWAGYVNIPLCHAC